ncbi:hypothetical protein ZIOFF_028230 [Zingiber officinale]|uniref:Reverse transcriptase domain-containing protein n=1 Tax=Zingiber officinale TaxID=94328 RepID=A0A8J5L9Q8_ZINOF|nr:hypothetical protein ZIOFF_028230 [Zingiber officinale]
MVTSQQPLVPRQQYPDRSWVEFGGGDAKSFSATKVLEDGASIRLPRSPSLNAVQCYREKDSLEELLDSKPMENFWLVGGDFNVITGPEEHSKGVLSKHGTVKEFNDFLMLAGLQKLQLKIKRLKAHLKWWNVDVFGNIHDEVKQAKEQFVEIEKKFDANPITENRVLMAKSQAHSIPLLISQEENAELSAVPLMEEVKQVIWEMNEEGAAGPDGFPVSFFVSCWEIICEDVLEAVVDFFHGGSLPKGMATTTLVLIPKIGCVQEWKDFRPISLCNVSNKIISKVLANKLRKILGKIISPSQSGFVKGRLISDNVLLAQELHHKLNHHVRGGNLVLKLDMAKAYDRVQWEFLFKVLHCFGFSDKVIGLIRSCIVNCWLFVRINGSLAGCSCNISHLAYAGDIMIMMNGSINGVKMVKALLDRYMLVSGQAINEGIDPLTYLGVPIFSSKRKVVYYQPLIEKIILPPISVLHQIEMIMAIFFGRATDRKFANQSKKVVWDLVKLKEVLPSEIAEEAADTVIHWEKPDQMIWKLSSDGLFSSKLAWCLTRQVHQPNVIWNAAWSKLKLEIGFFLVFYWTCQKSRSFSNPLVFVGIIKMKHWKYHVAAAQAVHLSMRCDSIANVSVVYWMKPKQVVFKLNFDGCSGGNPGESSFGVIEIMWGKWW